MKTVLFLNVSGRVVRWVQTASPAAQPTPAGLTRYVYDGVLDDPLAWCVVDDALIAAPVDVDRQWDDLRAERNMRLAATDHYALLDLAPMSQAMDTYRQALRDLPANTTDPANPTWPVKPEE